MYQLIRSILFLFDPEKVHYFSMNLLRLFCRSAFIKKLIQKAYTPADSYQQTGLSHPLLQLPFKNPIGLGAGFDKNARYLNELEALGFGFVEVGTVTPKPQEGNEKPRLFRLPKDKALINRMGFNNDGVEVIAKRLANWKQLNIQRKTGNKRMIIGGNIGKNKATPNEEAWKDYEHCFNVLYEYVDYFVVNVSSPNTPGLRALQEKDSLRKIFDVLHSANAAKASPKPILLKIAPDLTPGQVDDVIRLALEIKLDGLIVSNTTIDRNQLYTPEKEIKEMGAGGLSGKPLQQRSTELIRTIHLKTNNKMVIIGSGGIFNGKDAKEKMDAGASLVQVWTGFIYEGPGIVKKISAYLAARNQ